MDNRNSLIRPQRVAPSWALGLILAASALAGCSAADSAAGDSAGVAAIDQGKVLATVDGFPITMGDLGEELGDQLLELDYGYRNRRYELIEAALEEAVRDRLLAAEAEARGISVRELVATEAGGDVEVTEEEVNAWYDQNQTTLQGRSLEDIFPAIQQYLMESRQEAILKNLAREIRQGKEVVVHLEPVSANLVLDDSPARGPADAPITLVEFSDFECPYCRQLFTTLKRIEETYGERLRMVYKQFPLVEIHPHSFKAAEASLCAKEQGRFWEMHDLMFTEQDQLTIEDLKEKAGRLGIDRLSFDNCLDSGRYAEQIRRDQREGAAYGVTGTPAIFLNGVQLPGGAIPYEALEGFIEDELAEAR